MDTGIEDSLVVVVAGAAGMQGVVVVELAGVRRQSWVGNKKQKVVVAVVVAVIAKVIVVAGEVVGGSGIENENENENVDEDMDGIAAVGVDGGAKSEANMRPSLRLEVGKKSSSRRPGQLGSGQTGQNMNKNESDFGRRPGCGTS